MKIAFHCDVDIAGSRLAASMVMVKAKHVLPRGIRYLDPILRGFPVEVFLKNV
ncbi:hypothetical protein HS7_13580 [Sulfolobales archaeon HS-7]|nr:hypothetical protein HS7_13580 [Sulfolobales archaeon HS-7]